MEDDSDKAQSRRNAAFSDDDCSAALSVVSLLPCGTESEENKAPEETDDCGIAAAAANTANTGSRNSSSDVSMPWVKELPVHLLASFFQRMPPPLKRQVEMTNKRMAEIMKEHGWSKWHYIDIIVPGSPSGTFRVNDSFDVEERDVVACVRLLLSRICVRRFSLSSPIIKRHQPSERCFYITALLDALAESKDNGVAISELRLDVPHRLVKVSGLRSAFKDVVTAFCETLTHISTPRLDEVTVDILAKCDHLEVLVYDRGVDLHQEKEPLPHWFFKEAMADKKTLKSLSLNTDMFDPLDILTAGVHHLNHLVFGSLQWLNTEPTADQANLWSNLTMLEIDCISPSDMPTFLNVLRVAPHLKRLHLTGKGAGNYANPFHSGPGDVSVLVSDLADDCYRSRRGLTFSVRFPVRWHTGNAEDDDGAMLAAMMAYDKQFVTSSNLSHFGLMAFDERLHQFDANLTPATTEYPTQITSIDGSRVYKRLFKIDVRSDVRLSIGFDEFEMRKRDDYVPSSGSSLSTEDEYGDDYSDADWYDEGD